MYNQNTADPAQDSIDYTKGFNDLANPAVWEESPEGGNISELLKILESVRIDPMEPMQPPPVCLEIIGKDGLATVGTLGNFSMNIGKAKSRKTFLISTFVASAISNKVVMGVVKAYFPPDKRKVLCFDTEQGRYHVQKFTKRICKLAGIENPDNLLVYGLRKFKPSERLEIIEAAIYNTENVGLVIIDGIRDLLTSINDEEQATDLTTRLLRWTEERQIHVMCVLHMNKGDNNARGHIGSEMTNKAETVLSTQKSEEDKNISVVQAEYCRDKDPDPFAFEVNEFGLPQIASNWEVRTSKKPNGIGIDEIESWRLYQLFSESFSGMEKLSYSDLTTKVKFSFKSQFGKSIGTNKAKEIIVHAKGEKWVIQEKEKAPYTLGKFTPDA